MEVVRSNRRVAATDEGGSLTDKSQLNSPRCAALAIDIYGWTTCGVRTA